MLVFYGNIFINLWQILAWTSCHSVLIIIPLSKTKLIWNKTIFKQWFILFPLKSPHLSFQQEAFYYGIKWLSFSGTGKPQTKISTVYKEISTVSSVECFPAPLQALEFNKNLRTLEAVCRKIVLDPSQALSVKELMMKYDVSVNSKWRNIKLWVHLSLSHFNIHNSFQSGKSFST